MSFDFGKWDRRQGKQYRDALRYTPCCCNEKFPFKTNSTLPKYLEKECLGWTVDPCNLYTLNYILIILLTNLKYKGLLTKQSHTWIIRSDDKLEQALRSTGVPRLSMEPDYYFLHEIRSFIGNAHCEAEQVIFYTSPPFICPKGYVAIIDSIFEINSRSSLKEFYRFYNHG